MVEKVDQPTEGQTPAKPAKAETKKAAKKPKQPKQPKQQKQEDHLYLPVLVEFTFAVSVIFLVLVFLAVAIASWRTGANLLDFVIRTGVALGVLGSLLMAVSRQVTTGVLEVSRVEIEEELQQSMPGEPENEEQPEKPENIEIIGTQHVPEAQ